MGVGTKPHDHVDPPTGIKDPEGVGGGGPDVAKCWEFQLLDVTEIVQEVEVGTSVTGAAGPGEVEVFCAEGPLGRAPQAVARAMVEHLQANPSLRFAGNVTNIKARKAGPVVSVRLCLQ